MPRAFDLYRSVFLLFALLARAHAQHATELKTLVLLQPGITLPVELQHGLHAWRDSVGTRIVAKTTQRVPVARDLYLKRGAELFGEVTASTAGASAVKSGTLSIRFTALHYRHQTIPIATIATAIANFTDVSDTAAPANGSTDRGNPNPASWTTRQVGGDEVYRSGWVGDVCDSVMRKVGFADYYGVYRLAPEPGSFSLALGVFSATASGLYGLEPDVTLHSDHGTITLTGPPRELFLRTGDNLLLQVVAPN